MKKLLTVVTTLLMAACSNLSDFEKNALHMGRLDALYCEGEGFKSFQDLGASWVFVCKDNRRFIVRYD